MWTVLDPVVVIERTRLSKRDGQPYLGLDGFPRLMLIGVGSHSQRPADPSSSHLRRFPQFNTSDVESQFITIPCEIPFMCRGHAATTTWFCANSFSAVMQGLCTQRVQRTLIMPFSPSFFSLRRRLAALGMNGEVLRVMFM